MTKFDSLSISHRRGRKVADDHGQLRCAIPSTGLEVTHDGWLRVAEAAPSKRDDTPDTRPSVFFELTIDGQPLGTLVVDVYTDFAPRCARAFMARVADVSGAVASGGGGGGGGSGGGGGGGRGSGGSSYVGSTVVFDEISAAHVRLATSRSSVGDTSVSDAETQLSSSSPSSSSGGGFAQLTVEKRGGRLASHSLGAGVVSLNLADGSFAILFSPKPRWDRDRDGDRVGSGGGAGATPGGHQHQHQRRQVVGRVRRGCEAGKGGAGGRLSGTKVGERGPGEAEHRLAHAVCYTF